jgi:hypothetical protein
VADAAAVLEIEAYPPEEEEEEEVFDDGWGDISDPGKQSPEQVELAKKVRVHPLYPFLVIRSLTVVPLSSPALAHIVGRYTMSWNARQRSLMIFAVSSCLPHVHQLIHRQTPC